MEFLRLLESVRVPFFDAVFSALTYLGDEIAAIAVILVALWCVDKKGGYFLFYIILFSMAFNQLLKGIFCVPRPWILDPGFTIVESARAAATGYSFPSGHTATATSLYGGLICVVPKKWLRWIFAAVIALVAFSRMYLGVHTPLDVGVSLLLGLFIVAVLYTVYKKIAQSAKIALWLDIAVFIAALGLVLFIEFVPPPVGATAENTADAVKNAYTLLGIAAALALVRQLDIRLLRYDVRAVWWAQLIKCGIGLAILLAMKELLRDPLLRLTGGHDFGNTLRYFILVSFGGAVWPLTFRFFARLGKPRINITDKQADSIKQ